MKLLRDLRFLVRLQLPLTVVALLLQIAAVMKSQVSASGVFQLEVGPWINKFHVTAEGHCCEGRGQSTSVDDSGCPGRCHTFLYVCLSHYQAVIPDRPECTYGSVVTGADQFTDSLQRSIVGIPFEITWPGSFSVVVEAWNDVTGDGPSPGSRRTLIWRLATQQLLNASSSSSSGGNGSDDDHSWTLDEFRPPLQLLPAVRYRYRAVCDADFHGPRCTEFCRPRDDRFGHYDCDSMGKKLCYTGWTGTYCHMPVCRDGCHGYCRKPFDCRCRQGWTGVNCDKCVTKPGCRHGYCVEPWQCICNPGWTGSYCNHDVDFCSSHRPCQHGANCLNDGYGGYSCVCLAGFTGTNCERDLRDCTNRQLSCLHNGTCQYNADERRYQCQCAGDHVGVRCESMWSACHHHQQPCLNGGVCISQQQQQQQPGRCVCPPGFTGRFCEVDIDDCASEPCVSGRCVDERDGFRCVCAHGYSGSRCDVDVDDCQHLRGPCLNGGTCVDVLDRFSCRCPPGYSGSLCQFRGAYHRCRNASGSNCADDAVRVVEDVSSLTSAVDCSSSPCLNGAMCVDDDKLRFRCVCRRKFRGRWCHVQIAKRPHSKHTASSSATFIISTPSVLSVATHVTTAKLSSSESNVKSRQSLIVVVSPLGPAVVAAVAVASAMSLTASTAICIFYCHRRRRRQEVLAGHRACHRGLNATDCIHNNVKRQNNNLSHFKSVAKFYNVGNRL